METMINQTPCISLQTWTLRLLLSRFKARTMHNLLATVQKIGYRSLEVSLRGDLTLSQFLGAMQEAQLQCSGLHLPLLTNLSTHEVSLALQPILKLKEQLTPVFLDCPLFTFIGAPIDSIEMGEHKRKLVGHNTQTAKQLLLERFPKALFGYHLYDYDLRHLHLLRSQFDTLTLFPVVDTFFCYQARKNVEEIRRHFGNSPISFHLNNCQIPGPGHTCLSDGGLIDNDSWIRFALSIPNVHSLVVEHSLSIADDVLPCIEASLAYITSKLP